MECWNIKVLFIFLILLACFPLESDSGLIFALLLKMVALEGLFHIGVPLAVGSFLLGTGVGFFPGALFGGVALFSHDSYAHDHHDHHDFHGDHHSGHSGHHPFSNHHHQHHDDDHHSHHDEDEEWEDPILKFATGYGHGFKIGSTLIKPLVRHHYEKQRRQKQYEKSQYEKHTPSVVHLYGKGTNGWPEKGRDPFSYFYSSDEDGEGFGHSGEGSEAVRKKTKSKSTKSKELTSYLKGKSNDRLNTGSSDRSNKGSSKGSNSDRLKGIPKGLKSHPSLNSFLDRGDKKERRRFDPPISININPIERSEFRTGRKFGLNRDDPMYGMPIIQLPLKEQSHKKDENIFGSHLFPGMDDLSLDSTEFEHSEESRDSPERIYHQHFSSTPLSITITSPFEPYMEESAPVGSKKEKPHGVDPETKELQFKNLAIEKFLEDKLAESVKKAKNSEEGNDSKRLIAQLKQAYLAQLTDTFVEADGWTAEDLLPAIPFIKEIRNEDKSRDGDNKPKSREDKDKSRTQYSKEKSNESKDKSREYSNNDKSREYMSKSKSRESSNNGGEEETRHISRFLDIGPERGKKLVKAALATSIERGSEKDKKLITNFRKDLRRFFTLVTAFDQDKCLQKLVCDIHSRVSDDSDEENDIGPYETNILTTFKIMNVVVPLRGGESDASSKYRNAATLGSSTRSPAVCQRSFSSCKFSTKQIIHMGANVEKEYEQRVERTRNNKNVPPLNRRSSTRTHDDDLHDIPGHSPHSRY